MATSTCTVRMFFFTTCAYKTWLRKSVRESLKYLQWYSVEFLVYTHFMVKDSVLIHAMLVGAAYKEEKQSYLEDTPLDFINVLTVLKYRPNGPELCCTCGAEICYSL